ncbi:MAG TPA: hypothetical protein DCZ01_11195, partial [Elusimicrobia bacterium]|nr:hypothetical protein [Elusimicrobiota bacterium]
IPQPVQRRTIETSSDPASSSVIPGSTRNPSLSGNTKLGRNDPCFCGSGKKYKKCHGAGSDN